ncbi:MAG: hypothetical protein IIU52_03145 [Bacteroidaceae bacterium]|nr:hypothetical protein [Bacteroidaceae bacterium]
MHNPSLDGHSQLRTMADGWKQMSEERLATSDCSEYRYQMSGTPASVSISR